MSVGEGEGGERREGVEAGGGGDGYCGYHGYGYRFVMGHKIVTRTRTRAGKGVIPTVGYPYLCSSLVLVEEAESY